jgi:hypothetical protein
MTRVAFEVFLPSIPFAREDLVDLERLVAIRPDLDSAYVRRWVVEMMGDGDARVQRWDEITKRFS